MDALASAKRIVIKIGSALLVDSTCGTLRQDWLYALAQDIAAAKSRGCDVLLVSSGSIALGRRVLGLAEGALSLEQSQAAAAVGQIRLARAYEEVLAPHGITTAQILLTLDDSTDRRRYLNSRSTMAALMSHNVVPIVNENDSVATDEIRFGDNDRLAAQVASMAGADLLVLLSDVDGLYTGNPRLDADARHIPQITEVTREIAAMAGDAGTLGAKGGMKTKIMAAKTATDAGTTMVIMKGDVARPLQALANGAKASWFLARNTPQQARKQWIGALKPRGAIYVDAGAAIALASGKSLLSAGVTEVSGSFARGDLVTINSQEDGQDLGAGLSSYDAEEIAKIAGAQSGEIKARLGYPGRAAVIHRDDMVIR